MEVSENRQRETPKLKWGDGIQRVKGVQGKEA